ncbi:MAG: hypothetical protein OEX07_13360 [Gammaproteobacteria bacterium]|nr:hypothetical protein [Gammaproteobacteria bacterium]
MPEKILNAAEALLFALVIASGMMGGCAAASHYLIKGRDMKKWIFMAYAMMGGFFGVAVFIFSKYGYLQIDTTTDALTYSMMIGFAGTLFISATNFSAQFLLKRLGLKVTINVDKAD